MVTFNENDEVLDATTGSEGAPPDGAKPAETNAAVPVDAATAALVKRWVDDVKEAEKHWEDAFKRMDVCRKLAAHGTSEKEQAKAENGTYLVPILNRFINQAVASLYAKNPKAVAKRKDKLLYKLWDGDPASIMTAMQIVQATSQPQQVVDPMTGQPVMVPGQPDPDAAALLTEVQQVKQQLVLYDRMAKTMGLLFSYYLEEQDSGYEEQFKALVRRTKVCGVSYVDLDFQRILKKNPDVTQQIADTTSKIVAIETGLKLLEEGKIEEETAAMAELNSLLEDLQNKEEIVAREGPVLGFPRSDTIIPDKNCKHLKTFAGCRWISRRYDLLPEAVLATWGVDIGKDFTAYMPDGQTKTDTNKGLCRVYKVQDKQNQQVLVVCEGYPNFIAAPAEPTVSIERFWTLYPLIFNEVEPVEEGDALTVFPPPDVWNARHMQREYNSQRQGLREHRIAGRPGYAAAAGKLEETD